MCNLLHTMFQQNSFAAGNLFQKPSSRKTSISKPLGLLGRALGKAIRGSDYRDLHHLNAIRNSYMSIQRNATISCN